MRVIAAAAVAGEPGSGGGMVAGPARQMLTALLLEAVLAGRLSDAAVAARYAARIVREEPALQLAGWGAAVNESAREAKAAVLCLHGATGKTSTMHRPYKGRKQ